MLFAERVRQVLIEAQQPGAPHPAHVIHNIYGRTWTDDSMLEFMRDVTAVIAAAQPVDIPPPKREPKRFDIWRHVHSRVEWQLVMQSRLNPGMWIIERNLMPKHDGEQSVSVAVVSEPHWEFVR